MAEETLSLKVAGGAAEASNTTMAKDISPAAVAVNVQSDMKKLKCYFCSEFTVINVNLLARSFKLSGTLDMFWQDDQFLTKHPDVPQGSVASRGQNTVVWELADDGSCLPINPDGMFIDLISMSRPGPSRVLFDTVQSVVHFRIYFCAELATRSDMRTFPFDRHAFLVPLKFRTGHFDLCPEAPKWVPDRWHLRTPVTVTFQAIVLDEFLPRSDLDGGCCVYDCSTKKPVIKVLVQRHPYSWIMNVGLMAFGIVGLGCMCFVVPHKGFSDRMVLGVTLLLTLVALKFAVVFAIPRVPYLTYVDKYIIMSFVVLCLIQCCVTLSWILHDSPKHGGTTTFDRVVGSVFASVWLVFNAVLVLTPLHRNLRDPWNVVLNVPPQTVYTVRKETILHKMHTE